MFYREYFTILYRTNILFYPMMLLLNYLQKDEWKLQNSIEIQILAFSQVPTKILQNIYINLFLKIIDIGIFLCHQKE